MATERPSLDEMIKEAIRWRRHYRASGQSIEASGASIRERALKDARESFTGIYEPLDKLDKK